MENKLPGKIENDLDAYWDSIRKINSDHSFPAVATWIRETHKSVGRSRLEKRKSRTRSRWLVVAILPVFFILSCTIRINRVESSGNLVNFGIDKKEDRSLQQLSSLQQLFTFTCYKFLQPDQPAIAFYIFFIPDKERKKLSLITEQLKMLKGLQKLDISSINYTIRESLFSTFWHKTLQLGEQQKPKEEELTRNIRATLNDKGFGFLSISISNVTDGNISFTSPRQHPDTLTLTNQSSRPGGNKKSRNVNARNTPGVLDKLQIFNWLPGSWKVKYVTQTYHHWLRVNDSLLMCLIIRYRNEDDEPDISVGFSIRYSISDSAILSLRGIEWKFLSANDKEIHFKNETTPKSANVKWSLADDKKSWQSAISGEANLEVVNLIRDENINLENIVTEFIAKHPELIKKT